MNPCPRRNYRDDVELSIVGFGAIVVIGMEQSQADRTVAEVIDRGVNYFDVAPSYGRGEAQRKLGPALKGHRDEVFLACKTQCRDAARARQELEGSLRELNTDHFDLYQFHGLSSVEDVDRILADDGAGAVCEEAQRKGQVRYIGFSTHSTEAGIALMERAPFAIASMLFPLNVTCVAQGGFGLNLLESAARRGVARLALKAMAKQVWPDKSMKQGRKTWYQPIDDPDFGARALRWTLSQPITAAIPPGEEVLFRRALDVACTFQPLTEREQADLLLETDGLVPIFEEPAPAR